MRHHPDRATLLVCAPTAYLWQIQINGDIFGIFESSPGSTIIPNVSAFNSFGIEETEVESVTFESVGIEDGEWISLLEVGHSIIQHIRSETQNTCHQLDHTLFGSLVTTPPNVFVDIFLGIGVGPIFVTYCTKKRVKATIYGNEKKRKVHGRVERPPPAGNNVGIQGGQWTGLFFEARHTTGGGVLR